MRISTERALETIVEHAERLAVAAPRGWPVEVEACPGWRVDDVVRHLCEVHWFWATIVAERFTQRPELTPPTFSTVDDLAATFVAGARHLVETLGAAPSDAEVWTWAPAQHDVAFVTRHQVQEIAVHHFDVARAVGSAWDLAPDVAADAVEEFLTFSLSTPLDPADPPRASLNGRLGIEAVDGDLAWTVIDAEAPGTVQVVEGLHEPTAVLRASGSDMLLWMYGRAPIGATGEAGVLGERLRVLSFTD